MRLYTWRVLIQVLAYGVVWYGVRMSGDVC